MTYCVGMLVKDGLVLVSDSRTNAGVDHVSVFRKMTVWETPGERVIAMAVAGNLAVTQVVIDRLNKGIYSPEREEPESILDVHSMRDAAQLVGRAIRDVYAMDAPSLKEHGIDFSASFLLGGQVKDGELRLFHVYTAGNFIEATPETPFFQIGETKYGKPVLDRLVEFETPIDEALKAALISMDSTLRSNVSVGLPIDVVCISRDSLAPAKRIEVRESDEYFADIRKRWARGLKRTFGHLPPPPW